MVNVKNKCDYFQSDAGVESYDFPYDVKFRKLSCFFVVDNNGQVSVVGRNNCDALNNTALINAVKCGDARLFVSWMGRRRTDLFQITDLKHFLEKNPKIFVLSDVGTYDGKVNDCFQVKDEDNCSVFPYNVKSHSLSCFVVVTNDGQVAQIGRSNCEGERNRSLVYDVMKGEARLFVAWAGQYRTDFFQIRNIEKFMRENSHFL